MSEKRAAGRHSESRPPRRAGVRAARGLQHEAGRLNRARRVRRMLLAGAVVVALVSTTYATWGRLRADGGPRPITRLQAADVHDLAILPGSGGILFGHHGGVMRSQDDGRNWSALPVGGDAMALAVGPDGRRLYIAGHDVLRRSDDGGQTWRDVAHDLPGTDLHGFAVAPGTGRLYTYVVGQGLYASDDGGDRWRLAGKQVPPDTMSLTVDPDRTDVLFAGTMQGGVQRSEDGGRTWTRLWALADSQVYAVKAAGGGVLYAASGSGLFRGEGNGTKWTRVAFPRPVLALAIEPSDPRVMFVVDQSRDLYRTRDGGMTWQ